ncbi:MAG: NADPH-dependent F420 reductase [Candidatus Bathyarchaeota archaeon]|nr:NADPH-dependent F420 reductase [Candidatus Bathyarchaeota archaeon]
MKICILGGTGNMGTGLAIRWAVNHEIFIGSRSLEKAQGIAENLRKLALGFYQNELKGSFTGLENADALKEAEIVVVTLPPKATIAVMTALREHLREDQIIVTTVVPMRRRKRLFYFSSLGKDVQDRSAAEIIQEIVDPIRVVTAFQTVPAPYLSNIDAVLNLDVLVAGDDDIAVTIVSKLVRDIPNLRPLKVGPLVNSKFIEAITPLLLNAAVLNGLHEPSIRIVPWFPLD